MSALAPTLEAFFTDRLARQRQASPNTVAAYRDTFRLLLAFAHERTAKAPSSLDLADLDAPLIGEFLTHLETLRHNSARTRNARLAAIRSFFKFAAFRHPEHAALIQRVLAIPLKRFDRALVTFLDRPEFEALLTVPDRSTVIGRRDHTLLLLAVQTGLRLSELTGLRIQDLHLGSGPHLRCFGKGRKERVTPLTRQTVDALRAWLRECGGQPGDLLFPSRLGGRLSSDAVQRLVHHYSKAASQQQPSLEARTVTPHVLRHTTAMQLLDSGADTTVIALWLGHEHVRTTQTYLHADLARKERTLALTAPPNTKPGRYRPPDDLMAFLTRL